MSKRYRIAKRRLTYALALALALLVLLAPNAGAQFDLEPPEVSSEAEGGGDALEAGSHPYALTTEIAVKTELDSGSGKVVPVEEMKDLEIAFPPGLVGNPTAVPQCPTPVFLAGKNGECEPASAIGVAEVEFGEPGKTAEFPIYNLEPTLGTAAKVGFIVEDRAPVTIEIGLNPDSPNNVEAHATNVSQALFFFRARTTIWGNPADPVHDEERGICLLEGGSCESGLEEEIAFLTLPASCDSNLPFHFEADSWQSPGTWVTKEAQAGTPEDCPGLEFEPEIAAAPTTTEAASASGLDFEIGFDDPGLVEPDGRSQATIKKAVVTLPEGMVLNPGAADGLGSCSQAQFNEESLQAEPACPAASKVGEVEVETPLLEGRIQKGSIYVATPYENPFGTLLALYMVIREPELGILVKLPGKVVPDPATGQLTTTFGEAPFAIPQVPFSEFRFHFKEGPRAPLSTPPTCATHTISATFTPSSGNESVIKTTSFATTQGPGGSPCQAGFQPFNPGLEAGSAVPTAGAFSPFYMRLTRGAGQQELTSLAAILPPGVTGKIAGLGRCSQAALEAARARPGQLEISLPSCPADSRLGTIQSGAGASGALTYVGGSLYLAGPHNGAPLSLAAIVPAVAGPFDLGTVVVQQGLDLNPSSGEVEVSGAPGSIPRILQGIPLNLRDLRVSVDRPNFTLNPTDCDPFATRATLQGSGGASASPTAPYRVTDCAALGFKPKLVIKMKGATKRTGNPAVTAIATPRPGDANIAGTTVLLPKSQFIDNSHINNPCTRVQFAVDACPKGSVLGTARAFTPLLDSPLEGNVYFRSNGGERELPDIVADLRGQFRIILVGFVDSKRGRTRTRFLGVPDAPVSKFVLKLAGGKRGLLENSEDLCAKKQLAKLTMNAQNGRRLIKNQAIQIKCKGKGKKGGKR
jgi:hypothetical protein